MKVDYVPNEKYRNMFGVERNGYGMERVDLYLAQLEVAFKKIREDNRNLKRELSGRGPTAAPGAMGGAPQQEQYIAQLQNQLRGEQEKNHHLHKQLADIKAHPAAPGIANEQLVTQLNALRSEADYLRQQLRQQPGAASAFAAPQNNQVNVDVQDIMSKILGEARQKAADITHEAQKEAEQIVRKARQRVDDLRAERDQICAQLQGITYSVHNALKDTTETKPTEYTAAAGFEPAFVPEPNYMSDYLAD